MTTRKQRLPQTNVLALVATVLLLVASSIASAQQSSIFIYDQQNRLAKVVDHTGNGARYEYDAVGNLISITRATAAELVPVVTSTSLNILNQGETQEVVFSGTDFLGATVTTDNPGVAVLNVRLTDTQLTVTFVTSLSASPGLVNVMVTTSLGSVTTILTLNGPPPKITTIIPPQGSSLNLTPVTVTGTLFTPDTTFTVRGAPVSDVVFVNGTTMTATIPAGAPGLADVVVSNSVGSTTVVNGFSYPFPFSLPGAVAIETGRTGTLTAWLVQAGGADTILTLVNSNPLVATVPVTATIVAGDLSVDIPVTAVSEGTATIAADDGVSSLTTTVFVSPPFSGDADFVAAPVGVFVGPQVAVATIGIGSGNTQTIAVPLPNPVPAGGLAATLSSSNSAVATVPASVPLAAGDQLISFDATGVSSGTANITITTDTDVVIVTLLVDQSAGISGVGLAQPVGVFVTPGIPPVTTLGLNSGTIQTIAVPLPNPVPAGGLTAILSSSNPAVATVPGTVAVAAGDQVVSFDATGVSPGTADITITADTDVVIVTLLVDQSAGISGVGLAQPVGVFVTPGIPPVTTLSLNSGTIQTIAVPLPNPAPAGGLTATLSSSDLAVATVPATVAVAAGDQVVSFDATGVATGTARITLEAGADSLLVTLLVNQSLGISGAGLAKSVGAFIGAEPPPVATVGLSSGTTQTIAVPLPNPAPAGGLTATLTSSDLAVATVPGTVVLAEGDQVVTFDATGVASGTTDITIVAGADSLVMTVLVDQSLGITGAGLAAPVGVFVEPKAPGTTLGLSSGTTQTIAVPLRNPAPAGGLTATLSSSNPAVATVPGTVAVAAGEQVISFDATGVAAGTTDIVITAGTDSLVVTLFVDQSVGVSGAGLAPIVGVDVGP